MEPVFVDIDVAKDRLDVHLLPSGEAFAVVRNQPAWSSWSRAWIRRSRLSSSSRQPGDFEITSPRR
jgi:hypothetical protein